MTAPAEGRRTPRRAPRRGGRLRAPPRRKHATATKSATTESSPLEGWMHQHDPAWSPLPPPLQSDSTATCSGDDAPTTSSAAPGVPFFVMLPLDAVTNDNTLANPSALQAGARALKSIGVQGVTVDLWWGIVEGEEPRKYDFSAYLALARLMEAEGLQINFVLSFHTCGCNVGDSCSVPLPRWVEEACKRDPDLLYTDAHGNRNGEYLSLGADLVPALDGRTPIDCYADLARAFRRAFQPYLGRTVTDISVGLGPAGELRYPSYPEPVWRFPGVGGFQCYDRYLLANLRAAAYTVGRPEWRHGGPHDAGDYNSWPGETDFFREVGGRYDSDYGRFFTNWYAGCLVSHAERTVKAVGDAFSRDTGVTLSIKVPGIHWWAGTHARAAETTAGLYAYGRKMGEGVYEDIIGVCMRNGTRLVFTCLEMADEEQPPEAACAPEALLCRVTRHAWQRNVAVGAENALPRFDSIAHDRMVEQMYGGCLGTADPPEGWSLACFMFLRMSEAMFQEENWKRFTAFVRRVQSAAPDPQTASVTDSQAQHAEAETPTSVKRMAPEEGAIRRNDDEKDEKEEYLVASQLWAGIS